MAEDDAIAVAPLGSRVCNTCHERKPLGEFYPNPSCAGGRLPRCKSCGKTAAAAYNAAHAEDARARARKWRAEHLAEANARAAQWAKEHPDRIKEIAHKHRHSKQGKEAAKRYVETRDPARRHAAAMRYYEKNRDRYRWAGLRATRSA